MEELLRRLLGVKFGKESVTELNANPKMPVGTLIRKTDIAITVRSPGHVKRYERKTTQYVL